MRSTELQRSPKPRLRAMPKRVLREHESLTYRSTRLRKGSSIMASTSAFTEEGRTRIRNFERRVSSYLIVWILVGVAATVGCIYLRTRYGYRPLQRLYLGQYIKATIKSFFPLKRPSKYTLLVRIAPEEATGKDQIFGCTDDQVTPIRDETGRVKFDPKLGPFFTLQPGIPHTYFYWRPLPQMDKQMYVWFRDQIYNGRSLI